MRFTFHPANTAAKAMAHEAIRERCRQLAHWFNDELPDGREKSIVVTKLEEVMYWANAGLSRSSEQQ